MQPASVDIKDILVSETNLVFAEDLFVGREPDFPDNTTTVFDLPGEPPELTMQNDLKYYKPSIQIRVRNNDYLDGWNLIDNIKLILHGRKQETWNGSTYTLFRCTGEPALLDWDDNDRARFVATFNLQRK